MTPDDKMAGSNAVSQVQKSQSLKNPSIIKHFSEDQESEVDDDKGALQNQNCRVQKSILEIIKDDDEEKIRTSSNDI